MCYHLPDPWMLHFTYFYLTLIVTRYLMKLFAFPLTAGRHTAGHRAQVWCYGKLVVLLHELLNLFLVGLLLHAVANLAAVSRWQQ